MPDRAVRLFDPTGIPVAPYSSTTRTRISCWRSDNSTSIYAGILRQQLGGYSAAEETPARRQRERARAGTGSEPERFEPVERIAVDRVLESGKLQGLVE